MRISTAIPIPNRTRICDRIGEGGKIAISITMSYLYLINRSIRNRIGIHMSVGVRIGITIRCTGAGFNHITSSVSISFRLSVSNNICMTITPASVSISMSIVEAGLVFALSLKIAPVLLSVSVLGSVSICIL